MLNKHVKSPCCNAPVIRYGYRRRQCTQCKKTWRNRPLHRGRKSLRVKLGYLQKVFINKLSVRQIFSTRKISVGAIEKRFGKAMRKINVQPCRYQINGEQLILLIDAQWHYFEHELWTLYFIAIRSTRSEKATVLDPVLVKGKETAAKWFSVIKSIPGPVKKRIIAVVSDGLPGLKKVFYQQGWKVQRCHFHLISEFQKRRARRRTFFGKSVREASYQSVRKLLITKSTKKKRQLLNDLEYLSLKHDCPKKIRMLINDFVYRIDDFHTYLKYPKLNLPNTNNLLESIGSLIREKTLRLRTPQSWLQWATTTTRFHPKFICKRAKLPTKLFP